MQINTVRIPSDVLGSYNETSDYSISQKSSNAIFEKPSNSTLWAFDADGTIFETANGDHWFSIIKQLPKNVKERIFARAKLLGHSEDIFEQQYFSAASLYEFAKLGLNLDKLIKLSEKATMRPGAVEILNELVEKGHKVIIISHGIKPIIEAILKRAGASDQIEVFANETCTEDIYAGISPTKEYIPNYMTEPKPDTDNWKFLTFVKTMGIVPKNKGIVLEKAFKDSGLKNIFAIGDSNGDIEMFKSAKRLNGYGILHIHVDNKERIIIKNPKFQEIFNQVEFFCINEKDYSFKPTADLIREIIA